MYVDPNKVNLSEKDIEDWLWENPGAIKIDGVKIEGWLGRQVAVPSGVIDLLGYGDHSEYSALQPIIIELKNTEFTQAAILQVCRYAADIDAAVSSMEAWFVPIKIVVAKGTPSDQLLYEASAVDVKLCSFEVNYAISISGWWGWKNEVIKRNEEKNKQLGADMFLGLAQAWSKSSAEIWAPMDKMDVKLQLLDDSD